MKEEVDKANAREVHFKEELQILKKQLESVEHEKMRHLEENCSEREQWRTQYKRVEEENLTLKRELQDQIDQYGQIEETIKDIKMRESQLRDKFDREIESERQRAKTCEAELEEVK